MANCAVCGTELAPGAAECPGCGTPQADQPVIAGKYKLTRLLGRGGVGTVHLAVDLALDRPCAVKMLRPALASEAAVVQRLEKEARVLAKLEHPNVVPIYAVDRYNGVPFIVMKHLEGKTLAKLNRERGRPWTVAELTPMLKQLCDGLGFIHSKGVVHRDLKPGNLFVSPAGHLTILDLGVARTFDSTLTRPGLSLGTPHYMSPEQTAATAIDSRSDLYSLGVIVFEALTGRLPFLGDTAFDQMRAHREAPPPDASAIAPVPKEIGKLLQRLLSKPPADRFQTAGELADAWDAAAAASSRARPPSSEPAKGAPAARPPSVLGERSIPGVRSPLADPGAKGVGGVRPQPSLAEAGSKSTPGARVPGLPGGAKAPISITDGDGKSLGGLKPPATDDAPAPAAAAPAPALPNYGEDDEGATFLVSPSFMPGELPPGLPVLPPRPSKSPGAPPTAAAKPAAATPTAAARPAAAAPTAGARPAVTVPAPATRPASGAPLGATADATSPGRPTAMAAARAPAPPALVAQAARLDPTLSLPSASPLPGAESTIGPSATSDGDQDATNLLSKDLMKQALALGVSTGDGNPARTIENTGGLDSELQPAQARTVDGLEDSLSGTVTQVPKVVGPPLSFEALLDKPWFLAAAAVVLMLVGFLLMAAFIRG